MTAPVINTVSIGDNLRFNNETMSIEANISNMTGSDYESVFFKILGQDEVFGLSTIDNENYTGSIPLSRFNDCLYGLCSIYAINEDDMNSYDDLFVTLLDKKFNNVVKEGFGIRPSDWTDLGGIASFWGPIEGMRVDLLDSISVNGYYKETDIYNGNSKIHMMFMINGITTSQDNTVGYIGLFGDNSSVGSDKDNIMGFRFTTDTAFSRMDVDLYIKNNTILGLGELIEPLTTRIPLYAVADYDVWKLFSLTWDPVDRTVQVKIYRYLSGVFTLVESKCFNIDFDLNVEMNKYGLINKATNLGPLFETIDFWFNNAYLAIGDPSIVYPVIVTDTIIDTHYLPTDVQILVNYYDFNTGEVIEADGNLTVEILDSVGLVIDNFNATIRDDKKYEGFWSTLGLEKDTYRVRIISAFSGKVLVDEKLVSIQ